MHRWERDEPRLVLLAAPPATGDGAGVRGRVAAYQHLLAWTGPVMISPEWLRLTVAAIGWVRDITDAQYTRLLSELTAQLHGQTYPPLELGLAHLGHSAVSLNVQDVVPVVEWAVAAEAAARQVLGSSVEVFDWPRFGIAYARGMATRSDLLPRIVAANQSPELRDSVAVWPVERLLVAELCQDARRRAYRWTVRDTIPIATQHKAVGSVNVTPGVNARQTGISAE